jgi:hypothetical protein
LPYPKPKHGLNKNLRADANILARAVRQLALGGYARPKSQSDVLGFSFFATVYRFTLSADRYGNSFAL